MRWGWLKFGAYFFLLSACADFADVLGAKPQTPSKILHIDGRYYIVVEGDTLESIGAKYSLTAKDIAEANAIDEQASLTPGQKLLIPKVKNIKKTKESVQKQKKEKVSEEKIQQTNQTEESSNGEPQEDPKEEKVVTKKEDSKPSKSDSKFVWPVDGIVTSLMGPRRGRQHDGIDISAPLGTPIVAIKNGTVIFSGPMRGYGTLIIIKHSGNYFSAYAHMSQMKVQKGQKVKQGDLIGLVGRTGRASATHLHFEVRHKTDVVDPMKILPPKDPSKIRHSDLVEE